MSKRTLCKVLDKLFWALIMLLPLVVYVVYVLKTGSVYTLSDALANFGFAIDESSVIYQTYTSIFGVVAGGTANIPAFLSNGVISYITYITLVELIHLIVDILLYIPRIAQKYLEKGVD